MNPGTEGSGRTESPTNQLLSVADVAKLLQRSTSTVYRMIKRNRLLFVRDGRRLFVHLDSVVPAGGANDWAQDTGAAEAEPSSRQKRGEGQRELHIRPLFRPSIVLYVY
jgi:excisionase family DNA binding protein